MTASARRAWVWPLIAAAVGGLVYLNSLSNGFALDDVPLVRDNPDVQSDLAPADLLLRPYWGEHGAASGLYRPVTILSLHLNRRVSGSRPAGFHAVNVALHMLVCALVWYAARGAGLYYGTALAASLLFAVHPVHTEAVANVTGRAELLGAAGVLAAWLAFRRALAAGSGFHWPVLAGLFYLLALLSKENTVLAPLVFALEGYWHRRDASSSSKKRLVLAAAAVATAFVVGMGMRWVALDGLRGTATVAFIDNPPAFAGAGARIATALWVQVKYGLLFAWPFGLSSDYSFDMIPTVTGWLDARALAGICWAAGLVATFWIGARLARPVALGIAIWVLGLLPASNLLFVSGTIMAERLAYLPSLGACLILGHLVAWARHARRDGPFAIAGMLVVLVVLSVATFQRNPDWESNATLALEDAARHPRSAKLHAGAGIVLHDRGELDAAEQAYRRALAIYPDYAQIHYNLGELLLVRERAVEAVEHLRAAARIAPGNPRPHKTLALLLERQGAIEEALTHYWAGSRVDPGDLGFRLRYGRLLRLSGHAEASEVLGALARDDPQGPAGRAARALLDETDRP